MRGIRLVGVAAGGVLGAISATAVYGSLSRTSQLFGPSVHRGSGSRRTVALTFDDGPSEGTLDILEYLDRQRIWATFFQCGLNVRRHSQIAREVAAAGHQLGNHSYSHPALPLKSAQFVDREFSETQRVITDETGIAPMMMRPPYGFRWLGLRQVQKKHSLLGVMWTVMGNDIYWPSERIADHVLQRVTPGGIVCLHDGCGVRAKPDISNTLRALRRIVPVLKDNGFRFEVITDLMHA